MSNNISNKTETNIILRENKLVPKKSLGQNFLVDSNILKKIVNCAGIDKNTGVIEIGPGIGALTQMLALKAGKVVAVEIDRQFIPILQEKLSQFSNIELINKDILKISIQEIIATELKEYSKIKVVANLPYYITSPIIIKLLTEKINIDSLTILIQKEVAERINASPGGKDYGSLTILIKYYADVKFLFKVSSDVFIPKPKVDSAVIQLTIREEPLVKVINQDFFFEVIRTSFKHRRKTISNNIVDLFDKEQKFQLSQVLISCNIDGSRRAETLSIEEFAVLADQLYYLKTK